eukprot:COSAG02_NODE_46145_length_351_cov_0.948413_1_plen_53_part_10
MPAVGGRFAGPRAAFALSVDSFLPAEDSAIFFKQKTAYEIMSGDWSSDVCSSD